MSRRDAPIEAAGGGAPSVGHRRRPIHTLMSIALLALLVSVEALVFDSYQRTSATSAGVKLSTNTTTALANINREALLLQNGVSLMADRGDVRDLVVRRALLERQLTVLGGQATDPAVIDEAARLTEELRGFDPLLASARADDAAIPFVRRTLTERLAAFQLRVKAMFDDEESRLYTALNTDLTESAAAQRLLVGLGGSVLLLGVTLALFLRRAVRVDFARAHAALLTEFNERRSLERQLAYQAYHDYLTGLANSALFIEEVGRALARSARRLSTVALLYIDLDDFKAVNDRFGHASGDELLRQVADRLRSVVRETDTAARQGGDEFALLLEDAGEVRNVADVGARVLRVFEEPFTLLGRELRIGASIGAVVAPAGGHVDVDTLVRNADLAMYEAKSRGKGSFQVYEPGLGSTTQGRLDLTRDLAAAVEAGDIAVHFQPVVDLETGAITGFEALARWERPGLGAVSPMVFIPVAEESGLIIPLGEHVLAEACRAVGAWQAATGRPLTLAVNLSGRQLQQPDLVAAVAAALERSGMATGTLTVEITESVMVEDTEHSVRVLQELRSLGVRVAIDDFGVGYSALNYLRFLPIDELKVDRSFVDRIDSQDNGAVIAVSICQLAQNLGFTTVAEGIEREAQRRKMADLGCRRGQGFLFSPAVEADRAAELLAAGPLAAPLDPAAAHHGPTLGDAATS